MAGTQCRPDVYKRQDLMRLFGGDRVSSLMNTLKFDEDTPIENRMITNTLESAQKKLEGRNFEIRKNVLKYDDCLLYTSRCV